MRNRLVGTLASGRFPQVTLFVGPTGVGKQRLALWVAQAMLCADGPGEPCQECEGCRRATRLSHPDLHWFVPIMRPKATDSAKQVDEARELLAEVMTDRRERPLWEPPERMASHALASVRLLRKVVSLTPFLGPRKVVILGDANRLIVQEASQEAANALLKVLEEPPADTTIMLTTADQEALLPTIRSRAVPLRVGRVSDEAVRLFLEQEAGPMDPRAIARRVVLAQGCIGRALSDADRDASERTAREIIAAVRAGPRAWSRLALGQTPWAARGQFTVVLDALLVELRDRMVTATQHNGPEVPRLLEAVRLVEDKRTDAQGNANPQLALAVLASQLAAVL